jgi:hypothetical protein
MSGGSLDAPLQRYWFAEVDECSDDTPRGLSIGPNSGEASIGYTDVLDIQYISL